MNKVLSNKKTVAIFILPSLILFAVFVLIPIIYNVYISLFQTDLMGTKNFVGLRNYMNLLNDQYFLKALKNNAMLVVGSLIAHLPLTLVFGNFIFTKISGSKFFQSVFFLPSVICGAGVGIMFKMIYNSEFGLVNALLDLLHMPQFKHSWLNEEKTVMFAMILVVMWKFVGYHMVIQLAAMRSIPGELYESARSFDHHRFPEIFRSDLVHDQRRTKPCKRGYGNLYVLSGLPYAEVWLCQCHRCCTSRFVCGSYLVGESSDSC